MLVKDLIEDLKTMDPDAAVGFVGNGVWTASGIRYGHLKSHSRGYVLLITGDPTDSDDSTKHCPPIEDTPLPPELKEAAEEARKRKLS